MQSSCVENTGTKVSPVLNFPKFGTKIRTYGGFPLKLCIMSETRKPTTGKACYEFFPVRFQEIEK